MAKGWDEIPPLLPEDYSGDERRLKERRVLSPPFGVSAIFQAVLISAITGTLVHVFSIPKLEEKIDNLTGQIAELKAEQRKIREDFYAPRFSHSGERLQDFEPANIAATKGDK
jgi:hypothetical protein